MPTSPKGCGFSPKNGNGEENISKSIRPGKITLPYDRVSFFDKHEERNKALKARFYRFSPDSYTKLILISSFCTFHDLNAEIEFQMHFQG